MQILFPLSQQAKKCMAKGHGRLHLTNINRYYLHYAYISALTNNFLSESPFSIKYQGEATEGGTYFLCIIYVYLYISCLHFWHPLLSYRIFETSFFLNTDVGRDIVTNFAPLDIILCFWMQA